MPTKSLFSFMFSFWHSKTKSVTVNTELQWDIDLTWGKYLPLAKANKTKVQRASKPGCINVTAPGKRGDQRTLMKSRFSRGGGERLQCCVQEVCGGGGASASAREKQQARQGGTPGSGTVQMFSASTPGTPAAASLLRANQGKRN